MVKCLICGIEFNVVKYRESTAKYCSIKCKRRGQEGKNEKNYILFKCNYCGKEKSVLKSRKKKSKMNFCSNSCCINWIKEHSKKVTQNCLLCRKKFSYFPSRKRKFCSKKCSEDYYVGKNHLRYDPYYNTCVVCNKAFRVIKSKKNSMCCSIKCKHIYIGNLLKGRIINLGNKNGMWKGGKTKLIKRLRSSSKYGAWVKLIFERDDFICQNPNCKYCNNKRCRKLEAHHINLFSEIFHKNKINTFEEGMFCDELWELNNGITYCKKYHRGKHKEKW